MKRGNPVPTMRDWNRMHEADHATRRNAEEYAAEAERQYQSVGYSRFDQLESGWRQSDRRHSLMDFAHAA